MKHGSQYKLWLQWFVSGTALAASAFSLACGGDGITGPVPVASVSVAIAAPSVAVGTKTQATATVRDDGGNALDGRLVTWSSSDTEVASVSSTGEVTALRAGTAEIRATSEGKVGTATVTVLPPPVATVTVTLASSTISAGSTTTATAVTSDASGNVLTGRTIAWSSSDVAIATVSDQGVVTAVSNGNASIIATSEGKTGSAPLTVSQAPINTITVVIADPSMQIGGTRQASAVARDANGNVLTGRPVVWTTDNADVATVSTQGVVSGLKAGTATITATSEGKSGSAAVTVSASVSGVVVTLPQPGLSVGFSIQASATVTDASGNPVTGQPVTWSSSNTAVATVSQTGVVTGVGRGDAEITATSDGKTSSATIGVVVIRQQSLSVGNGHTCAIAVDGDAYCWGLNNQGQLGRGFTSQTSPTPARVEGGIKFAAISAGFVVTYALAENGQMYCWGFCPPDDTPVLTPRPWSTARPAEVVDANDSGILAACLLRVGETAWCWGGNLYGQLGRGTRGEVVDFPEGPVAGNHAFADIATGNGQHVCAVSTTGIGYCWGGGKSGERGALGAGAGAAKESTVPQAVSGDHVFKDISVTELHTCAVTTAGEAWCWGDNNYEQLGAPTGACPWPGSLIDTCSAVPVAVTGGHVFESISVGDRTSCGVRPDGEIYCWGQGYGMTPGPFGGGVKYRSVSSAVCALSTDGDVYCRSNGVVSKVAAPVKFRVP